MRGQPPTTVLPSDAGWLRLEKDAARIAQPNPIRRPMMKTNISRQSVRSFQYLASFASRRSVLDDQFDSFMPGQVANNFCEYPRDRFELTGPVSLMMGPCQPGGRVGLPLRGHAIPKRGRWSMT